MTPLASFLVKQLTARPKHREGIWVEPQNLSNLRSAMYDIHCFEVTACLPMLPELTTTFKQQGLEKSEDVFESLAFLPAPKTWLEWRHPSGNSIAILLEEKANYKAGATFFCKELATNLGEISTNSGDYYDYGGDRAIPTYISNSLSPADRHKAAAALLSLAHILLLIVNSPKIVGRLQHSLNKNLARKLTENFKGVGFPLHAWTEVLLQVNKPVEIDDGLPHEAGLTGNRALHFVRKHIRIRLGKLEYVSSHWRGDPSIGIKQTRYVVTP